MVDGDPGDRRWIGLALHPPEEQVHVVAVSVDRDFDREDLALLDRLLASELRGQLLAARVDPAQPLELDLLGLGLGPGSIAPMSVSESAFRFSVSVAGTLGDRFDLLRLRRRSRSALSRWDCDVAAACIALASSPRRLPSPSSAAAVG